MTSRPVPLALVALALAGIVAGCAPTPASTPTPTSGFASDAEAFAAAEETYRAYVDALNRVDLSDPETFEDVYAWTTGELNASDRHGLSGYHADGLRVTGESVIQVLEPRATTSNWTELAACLDVSSVEVVDAAGESLVDADRADVQTLTVRLVEADESPTNMKVQSIGPREGEPKCEP